ncbi:MAG: hypothetical protein PHW52_00385 [Candidatus Pacebacteria bacterium]|nr:hypothetical protein [Candidatus Paceibacterota bacterium]
MQKDELEKDFIVTDEDEKIVAARLQSFSVPVREEPKVYQPIIFIPDSEKNENIILPQPFYEEKREARIDSVEEEQGKYLVLEISSSYYNNGMKKIVDFIFGFLTVVAMFYFLTYQPILIFLIYMIGMVLAFWAFRAKRLYVIWGFLCGAVFSMFFAILVYASTI